MIYLGLEDFQTKFGQTCEDNEVHYSSWVQLVSSKWESKPAYIIQWDSAVDLSIMIMVWWHLYQTQHT